MSRQGPTSLILAGMLILGLCAASSASRAGDLGHCATAWVPREIVLPDGSEHERGAIRFCLKSTSPNSGTYALWINGMPIGEWPSRIGRGETVHKGRTLAVFEWLADGRLALVGYSRPDGDQVTNYVFHEYGPIPERVLTLKDKLLSSELIDRFVVHFALDSKVRG